MVKFSVYLNRLVFVMGNAQADLSICWTYMSEGSFSDVAFQNISDTKIRAIKKKTLIKTFTEYTDMILFSILFSAQHHENMPI